MADESVDISPETYFLQSLVDRSGFSFKLAVAEWIDNSLDSGAARVEIATGSRSIQISDDGSGFANVVAMAKLGRHEPGKNNRIGAYGIGGKEAAVWIGGLNSRLTVTSIHGGVRRELVVDWANVCKSTTWKVPPPRVRPSRGDERGTTIEVTRAIRKIPTGERLARLIAELGYLYFPAIADGKQIIYRQKSAQHIVTPWAMPLVDNGVDIDVDVLCADGRTRAVHIRCGVVKAGEQNPKAGITYVSAWRVIKPAGGFGCGGMVYSRICGVVTLGKGWKLAKNKDDITRFESDLYAAVHRAILPVLNAAKEKTAELESAALIDRVEGVLNDALKAARGSKERRDKGPGGTGAVEPVGTSRKRRARKTQPADGLGGLKGVRRLRLVFVESLEGGSIGEFDPSGYVKLSLAHPWVRNVRDTENDQAIIGMAFNLVAEAVPRNRQLPLFRDLPSDHGRILGQILASAIKAPVAEVVG